MATASEGNTAAAASVVKTPGIAWNERRRRFETEDHEAYIKYVMRGNGKVMDLVHTYVPPSKRGLGWLLTSASPPSDTPPTIHLRHPHLLETFLPRNPSWKHLVRSEDLKSSM